MHILWEREKETEGEMQREGKPKTQTKRAVAKKVAGSASEECLVLRSIWIGFTSFVRWLRPGLAWLRAAVPDCWTAGCWVVGQGLDWNDSFTEAKNQENILLKSEFVCIKWYKMIGCEVHFWISCGLHWGLHDVFGGFSYELPVRSVFIVLHECCFKCCWVSLCREIKDTMFQYRWQGKFKKKTLLRLFHGETSRGTDSTTNVELALGGPCYKCHGPLGLRKAKACRYQTFLWAEGVDSDPPFFFWRVTWGNKTETSWNLESTSQVHSCCLFFELICPEPYCVRWICWQSQRRLLSWAEWLWTRRSRNDKTTNPYQLPIPHT